MIHRLFDYALYFFVFRRGHIYRKRLALNNPCAARFPFCGVGSLQFGFQLSKIRILTLKHARKPQIKRPQLPAGP